MKLDQTALKETLDLAEQEHWLDCPNANWALRLASSLLDCIFIYLAIHTLHKLVETVSFHSSYLKGSTLSFLLGMAEILLRGVFVFLYLIMSSNLWGATLGKLLLGLRLVDEKTGGPLTMGRVCSRVFWGVSTNVFSILVAIFRKDQRFLHDLLTESVVKKTRGRH